MCVPLPHEQDTNSADTAYEIVCLRILEFRNTCQVRVHPVKNIGWFGRIRPEYLWFFLRQESFREEAESHMTGAVGQRRVPTRFLQEAPMPLPPIEEQRGIV